jgi:hypothetical protein
VQRAKNPFRIYAFEIAIPQSICGAPYPKENLMNSQTRTITRAKRRRVAWLKSHALCAAHALLLILAAAQASAQTATPTPAPTPAATPTSTPTPPALESIIKVTDVYNFRYHPYYDHKLGLLDANGLNAAGLNGAGLREAGLNERIVVAVENLQALLKRSNCESPYDEKYQKPCVKQPIALFFNGRMITGLKPEIVETRPIPTPTPAQSDGDKDTGSNSSKQFRDGILSFHLRRADDTTEEGKENLESWADLLGLTPGDLNSLREVRVGVGLADGGPIPAEVGAKTRLSLVRFSIFWLMVFIPFFLLCMAALIYLALKKDLLRDRAHVIWEDGKSMPYSLSLVQAAWWFVIVLGSFFFIWVVTGQYDYSATAIILLSISLGTALGGSVIDINKQGRTEDNVSGNELELLLAEKRRLESQLTEMTKSGERRSDPSKFSDVKKQYDDLIVKLGQKFPSAIGHHSEGFCLDILSDANGVSFHRFQMAIWTLALGVFFIISTLGHLEMPEFNTTLLALMGVSATAYLGFKIPEDTRAPAHTPTPTTLQLPPAKEPAQLGPAEPQK